MHTITTIYTPHTKDEHVIGVASCPVLAARQSTQRSQRNVKSLAQRTQEISQVNSQLMRENQIRALTGHNYNRLSKRPSRPTFRKLDFGGASHDLIPAKRGPPVHQRIAKQTDGEAETLAQNLDGSCNTEEQQNIGSTQIGCRRDQAICSRWA